RRHAHVGGLRVVHAEPWAQPQRVRAMGLVQGWRHGRQWRDRELVRAHGCVVRPGEGCAERLPAVRRKRTRLESHHHFITYRRSSPPGRTASGAVLIWPLGPADTTAT